MTPRDYRLGQRQAAVDATRRKVLDAARDLLADPAGYPSFTVDAVAKRADVARATVYYQFDSKSGLLEALFDSLAEQGQMAELPSAFTNPDSEEALRRFVACFVRFWASDRIVLRRIRAIAALDPEVGPLIAARDERRRMGLRVLAARFDPPGGLGNSGLADTSDGEDAGRSDDRLDVVHALTSFETYDALSGPGREPDEVIGILADLAVRVMTGR